MNTLDPIPQTPPARTGSGETMLSIFIPAPAGLNTSVCMVSPVRRCFSVALGRAVTAVAAMDGVFVLITTQDREREFPIVREELRTLGYDAVAHVGFLKEDGWQCLLGSGDFFASFDEKMRDVQSQMEFATQIQTAHFAASAKGLK